MYCLVCGCSNDKELIPGMICSCCGYEYAVDDYITGEETYIYSGYSDVICEELRKKIQKLGIDKMKPLPLNIVYEILRRIWINKGCIWLYGSKGRKPIGWNLDMAKQQLANIDVDIEQYLISKK